MTNLIKKNIGMVEKIGAIIGEITSLKLNILTNNNITPKFSAYSNTYTSKLSKYFFKEYFSSLNVYFELR